MDEKNEIEKKLSDKLDNWINYYCTELKVVLKSNANRNGIRFSVKFENQILYTKYSKLSIVTKVYLINILRKLNNAHKNVLNI